MTRFFKIIQSLAARPRLLIGVMLAVVGYTVLSQHMRATQAVLLAFDAGALFFLTSITVSMSRASSQVMYRRAERQIYGKWAVLISTIVTIAIVLLALHDELRSGKAQAARSVAFAGFSLLLAWLFLAANFAQEYAHQFARNRHKSDGSKRDGGLMFPGTPEPTYWDFMYFSLILSVACQTADVQITDGWMRRLSLLQSVISFFFNVIIISISINVLAGVL
jgi:uncharacterized membrane protein